MPRLSICVFSFALASVTWMLVGCGPSTSAISGKVTQDGQPVTGGSITFFPQAVGDAQTTATGPVSATIGSDGSYKSEPAASGTYKVSFAPPVMPVPGDGVLKPGQSPPPSPWDGMKPKTETVEVKAGSAIDIELTK